MSENEGFANRIEIEAKPELHVLGAEDDQSLRALEEVMFRRLGIDFTAVPGGQEGLAMIRENPSRFNAVISDRDMNGMNGEEFLAEVKRIKPDVVTALVTGRKFTEEELEEMRRVGVDHYINKPFDLQTIEALMEGIRDELAEKENQNDI